MPIAVSVVIPARNEAACLEPVIAEVFAALPSDGDPIEIVVVDDGSTDATPAVLKDLARRYAALTSVTHRTACGKSAALATGIRAAQGHLICTMDADGQNDPRYLPRLLNLVREPGVGLAAGQRISHAHPLVKRVASKIANGARNLLLGDGARDTACGLKAFPRSLFLALPYFDGMHRFLPALILAEGYAVRYLDIVDRPRLHGQSRYGVLDRARAGVVDLAGVAWLVARRQRRPDIVGPLHGGASADGDANGATTSGTSVLGERYRRDK